MPLMIVDRHLVVVVEKLPEGSDRYEMACTCGNSRKRKNNTCQHTDAAMALVKQEYKDKVQVVLMTPRIPKGGGHEQQETQGSRPGGA